LKKFHFDHQFLLDPSSPDETPPKLLSILIPQSITHQILEQSQLLLWTFEQSRIPGDPQFIGSPNNFREKLSIVPSKVRQGDRTCSSTPSDQGPRSALDLLPFRRHPAPPPTFQHCIRKFARPCGESHATIRSINFATTDQTDHRLFQSERFPTCRGPIINLLLRIITRRLSLRSTS
jgi:hypothetical protein